MRNRYKIVTVVERFEDEKRIPRERLSCGHVRTDPVLFYSNETAFKIKRLAETINNKNPIKARCYKCGKENNAKEEKA